MTNEKTVHLPEVMKSCTLQIKVTGTNQLAFRIWLGGKLLSLAALVMGCDIEVSMIDQ